MFSRKVAIILLIFFVALLFWGSASLQAVFYGKLSLIEAYVARTGVAGGAVFILLAAISVLLGPFTSIPLVPLAVGAWGVYATFLLILSGWLLGGIVAYGVGHIAGYPLVVRLLSRARVEKWMKKVEGRLEFLFLLLFRIAMPSETGYLFGMFRYDFLKYLLITLLAEIPFALIVVYASEAFLEQDPTAFFGLIVVGLALMGGTLFLFSRRLTR